MLNWTVLLGENTALTRPHLTARCFLPEKNVEEMPILVWKELRPMALLHGPVKTSQSTSHDYILTLALVTHWVIAAVFLILISRSSRSILDDWRTTWPPCFHAAVHCAAFSLTLGPTHSYKRLSILFCSPAALVTASAAFCHVTLFPQLSEWHWPRAFTIRMTRQKMKQISKRRESNSD